MSETCFVCKAPSKRTVKTPLFGVNNVLPSKRNLIEILREIIDKPLDQESAKTSLCTKCTKSCIDYDEFKTKLDRIKKEMCENYFNAQQKIIQIAPKQNISIPHVQDKMISTIVVPASKLQPLPPDFPLNLQHLAAVSAANLNSASVIPQINLKVTIGSSVFTQSLATSTVKITKPIEIDTASNEWTIENLPKDIFSTSNNDDGNNGDDENNCDNGDDDDNNCDNDGEGEMEIDEECTLAVIPSENEPKFSNIKLESPQLSEETQYFNVLPNIDGNTTDGNYVISKLKILNENDNEDEDEKHTIIVDGKSSIFEMMTGQKLVYENGELSLVMQEGDENDGDDNNDYENGDEQDSNDETQIELQVSGDEETANAIIAAAQEKGGAFIKVESGEMYRVKSVHSKNASFDVSTLITKDGNKFKCVLCEKAGKNENISLYASLMMRHLKEEHDVKLYICQMCGIGMRKRQEYAKHIAEHSMHAPTPSSNKPHECPTCSKRYTSRTLLHEHMHTHTGARPFSCHVCDKRFASKYTMQAHLKTHQVRPRPFKCKQCGKAFLSQQNLTQHEKTHSGVKNFVCEVCNKSFVTQHNLEIHGIVHSGTKPHTCGTCSKAFARKTELVDHMRTHTGERPFECTECGARFAQRSNLHSHRRATHLDDKRHHCVHCPKRFKRRRLLEYHIKASHTGERPLKCDICNATFVYPEHYKKHVMIHSGERPYFCEICGKSFNSRDNRNTHRFTHSDKKPYECLACGHSYMRKRLLIAHMNTSGHYAESIVVNQPRLTRVSHENGFTKIVQLVDKEDREVYTDELGDEEKNTAVMSNTTQKLELFEEDQNEEKFIENVANDEALLTNTTDELSMENAEAALIEDVNSTQLETQTAQIGDEVLRLIQVKLPDGNNGWVALN